MVWRSRKPRVNYGGDEAIDNTYHSRNAFCFFLVMTRLRTQSKTHYDSHTLQLVTGAGVKAQKVKDKPKSTDARSLLMR